MKRLYFRRLTFSFCLVGCKTKKPIQTKYRMPLLNWQVLKSNQVTGTIFSELDDEHILEVWPVRAFYLFVKMKKSFGNTQHWLSMMRLEFHLYCLNICCKQNSNLACWVGWITFGCDLDQFSILDATEELDLKQLDLAQIYSPVCWLVGLPAGFPDVDRFPHIKATGCGAAVGQSEVKKSRLLLCVCGVHMMSLCCSAGSNCY